MKGTIAALATPWDPAGGLDIDGLERLVERVVSGGADGISPAGSTGEGAMLTPAQRAELTRRVRELTPANLPVITGLPLRTLAEGVAELHTLAESGATAALVAPPTYYPLSDDAVRRLYTQLADRSPLPVVLYCIPRFTKVSFSPAVVKDLAAHPNVIGIKDSSRDMEYQQDLIKAAEGAEFTVLTGTDTLLVASLALGVAGTIAASVNLVPALTKEVFQSYADGDVAKANSKQHALARIVVACRGNWFPAGWKAALEIAGVCGRHPVPPGTPLTDAQVERLRDELSYELGLSRLTSRAPRARPCTQTRLRTGMQGVIIRMRHFSVTAAAVTLAAGTALAGLAACGSSSSTSSTGAGTSPSAGTSASTTACTFAGVQNQLYSKGVLTVATDTPAYTPWFVNNQPSNGQGYESAVAYAVAQQLGFSEAQVKWVTESFNNAYAPGPKKFDFDINEVSYSADRANAVTFSASYYDVQQAVVALKNSPIAAKHSAQDLKTYVYGDQIGTTSLSYINTQIQPTQQPKVYDDLNSAIQALRYKQIGALVMDTPTAQYASSQQIPGSVVVGQFPAAGEHFGLVFTKGNPLATCVNQALAKLKANGALAQLQSKWLQLYTSIPTIQP